METVKQALEKAKNFFSITPDMDLFASCLNYEIKPLASVRPDPDAICVDAFQVHWNQFSFLHSLLFSFRVKYYRKQ